jgi:hypothetical protein
MTPTPASQKHQRQHQSPSSQPPPPPREDMYRTILREIGCENGGNMDYLFDSDDGDDENNFSLLDSSSDESENNTLDQGPVFDDDDDNDNERHDHQNNSNNVDLPQVLVENSDDASDESLLHQWEEDGGAIRKSETVTTVNSELEHHNHHAPSPSPVPEWREKLNEAQMQQQRLQQQFLHLQETQRRTSPSHGSGTTPMRHKAAQDSQGMSVHLQTVPSTTSSTENLDPGIAAKAVRAATVTGSSSPSSSFVYEELSARNTQLEKDWETQQIEAAELQTKLTSLQIKVKKSQKQWEEDQTLLFSPVRIDSAAANTNNKSTLKSPARRNAYPSSLKGPNSPSKTTTRTPTLSSHKTTTNQEKVNDEIQSHLLASSPVPPPDLEKEQLQQHLDDFKAKIEQKDADLSALQCKYESEKQEWEKSMTSVTLEHNREKEALAREVETAKERLQDQVTLNQDLREELQELKSSGWKSELQAAQTKIKEAVKQQSQKTAEFQTRIQALEGRHEEERQQWKKQLSEYQQQLEENTALWEDELQAEKKRNRELQEKHARETNEWQALLEKEMGTTEGDEGFDSHNASPRTHSLAMVSNTQHNDASLDYSSIQDKSGASGSMERIDDLLEELGRMDQERAAMLNEINGDADHHDGTNSKKTPEGFDFACAIDDEDGGIPNPVESPQGSVTGAEEDPSSDVVNAADESTMLDQTLSLLHNLKDLMECNGNGYEQEASVLERLEVLSDLMQDESGRRSIMLSPGRNLSAISDGFGPSEEKNEKDTSLVSSTKLAADLTDPWPALVEELKSRIAFLEHDRDELARITELIMHKERESHHIKLDAAVATARREVEEKLHKCQLEVTQSVSGIYRSLCPQCQSRVYNSLK